jgi:hypothetical protein
MLFRLIAVLSVLSAPAAFAVEPAALRAHVGFLASDLLEGRDTPSRGLAIAGEYIAAQMQRAGLEAGGDQGYFQTAAFEMVKPSFEGFELKIDHAGKTYAADAKSVSINASGAAALADLPIVKVDLNGDAMPAREAVEGKAVWVIMPPGRFEERMRKSRALRALNPALLITADFAPQPRPRLREANSAPSGAPSVTIDNAEFRQLAGELPAGPTPARVSAKIPAPVVEPVPLRNVIGILRGTDPALKETAIVVSAHYDHVGTNEKLEGDKIFNGANDDASGVAAMLEIAAHLSSSPVRPKRSIVFAAWFGEEKGLFGSRYYAKHPVFPLAKTVANLNLEHLGRTDDNEGERVRKLSVTGYEYSTLVQTLVEAGKETGVEILNHATYSDSFFGRSDNQAFADAGVPAHTALAVYLFPDYHKASDHADKLDYENLAALTRTLAAAAARVAGSAEEPRWSETNPKAEKYFKAWKSLHNGAHAAGQ